MVSPTDLNLPELLRKLATGEPRARQLAATHLGILADTRAVAPLIAALEDPSPGVRTMSAISLARMGAAEAAEAIGRLLTDGDAHVRSVAASALGQIGGPVAFRLLVDAVRGDDAGLHGHAALSLGHMGDREAVPYVLPLLDSACHSTRLDAGIALCWLGEPAGQHALQELLDEGQLDPDEAEVARRWVREFGQE